MTGLLLQCCPSQTESGGRSLRFLVQTVSAQWRRCRGAAAFKGTLHTTRTSIYWLGLIIPGADCTTANGFKPRGPFYSAACSMNIPISQMAHRSKIQAVVRSSTGGLWPLGSFMEVLLGGCKVFGSFYISTLMCPNPIKDISIVSLQCLRHKTYLFISHVGNSLATSCCHWQEPMSDVSAPQLGALGNCLGCLPVAIPLITA